MKKYTVMYDTSEGVFSESITASKVVFGEMYIKFYNGSDLVMAYAKDSFIGLSVSKINNVSTKLVNINTTEVDKR